MASGAGTRYSTKRSPYFARTVHRRVELRPVGSDGSAAVTQTLYTGPCRVTHMAIDYIQQPATTDTVIKAENTNGVTLYTETSDVTDLVPRAVATPGAVDEGGAAAAATDGVDGGWFIKSALFFDIAQGDGQTTGDEVIIVDIWFEPLDLLEVTLHALGSDNSATVTRRIDMHGAGRILGIGLNYGSGAEANGDIIITADVLASDNTGGVVLFTRDDSATDLDPTGLGIIGVDEAEAAVAATDAIGGGQPFKTNLLFDYHDADLYATNEELIVTLWIA